MVTMTVQVNFYIHIFWGVKVMTWILYLQIKNQHTANSEV